MKLTLISALGGLCLLVAAGPVWAQKSGQSITIVHGTVVGVKNTEVSYDAGKGALVGGTIGYASSSGKSSSKKRRNSALGAVAGGVVTSRAQGDRSAKEYTVETSTGVTVILSDQTEIVVGDCVVVENGGSKNANIRRVSQTYCEPAAQEVVESMADEMMEEAEECAMAKRELAVAGDDLAFDRAVMKVQMLCDS